MSLNVTLCETFQVDSREKSALSYFLDCLLLIAHCAIKSNVFTLCILGGTFILVLCTFYLLLVSFADAFSLIVIDKTINK